MTTMTANKSCDMTAYLSVKNWIDSLTGFDPWLKKASSTGQEQDVLQHHDAFS